MSSSAAKLLSAFEALPTEEKQEVVNELLRRFSNADIGILHDHPVDLLRRGIDQTQAADLRARLKSFAEDWDRPEAAIYDENPPR